VQVSVSEAIDLTDNPKAKINTKAANTNFMLSP
jgi:hypothetical protein